MSPKPEPAPDLEPEVTPSVPADPSGPATVSGRLELRWTDTVGGVTRTLVAEQQVTRKKLERLPGLAQELGESVRGSLSDG